MSSTRYCLTLAGSFLLWVVPVNIKQTPKEIVFLSLIGSAGGFLYALALATPMSDQQWYKQQKRIQEREVLLHDFALGELALKQALELEYFSPAQLEEKEAIALEQGQQNLKESPEQKLLPDALPEHLQTIIQLAKEEGGKITQRGLMKKKQFKDKVKAAEMQTYLRELQKRGYGQVTTDGRTYTFHLTRVATGQ